MQLPNHPSAESANQSEVVEVNRAFSAHISKLYESWGGAPGSGLNAAPLALNGTGAARANPTPAPVSGRFQATRDSFCNRMRRFDPHTRVKAGKARRHPIRDAVG
jgi:hypothetical protein